MLAALVAVLALATASCATFRPRPRCHAQRVPFYQCRADGTLETTTWTLQVCE